MTTTAATAEAAEQPGAFPDLLEGIAKLLDKAWGMATDAWPALVGGDLAEAKRLGETGTKLTEMATRMALVSIANDVRRLANGVERVANAMEERWS
jgi:hypothetical protein